MKIARFTEAGRTRLGIVATDADEIIDVGTADPSLPTDLGPLLSNGELASVARTAGSASRVALSAVQLEAPIPQPPTFLAIGLNYADHVAESGMDKPKAPVVFNKQITCVVGPGAGIEVPQRRFDRSDRDRQAGGPREPRDRPTVREQR